MAWAIGRSLRWLGRALLSPSGEGPREFDDGPVTPVVDVLQGGVGLASVFEYAINVTGAEAATTRQILASDPNVTRLVWISIVHDSGATAVEATVSIEPPMNSTTRLILSGATSVPATNIGRRLSHAQLCGSQEPIRVPPGCELNWRHYGIAAGEVVQTRCLIVEVPAGSKPW